MAMILSTGHLTACKHLQCSRHRGSLTPHIRRINSQPSHVVSANRRLFVHEDDESIHAETPSPCPETLALSAPSQDSKSHEDKAHDDQRQRRMKRPVIHVFWDLDNKHPDKTDPAALVDAMR